MWHVCGLSVSPENRVVLVFLVWFSYKLDTWCGRCVCIGFWPGFLINWPLSLFLNEKAKLLLVSPKSRAHALSCKILIWSLGSLSPFFELFKTWHFKVLNNFEIKYMDVVNYVHCERANFQYELPCIVGSTKKKN
jgi:hypothetical protein